MLNFTPQPDLNALAKRIRAINTEKGFWPPEGRNWGEVCALIISELMEALEAHRKGKRATGGAAKFLIEQHAQGIANWPDHFVKLVKDTVDDELADAVIRILDCSGAAIFEDIADWLPDLVLDVPGNFGESLLLTIKEIAHVGLNGVGFVGFYTRAEWIANIEVICRKLEIDLWAHVEAKILYNQTRPAKHGKLY
jgi:hypothetical protein